MTTPVCWCTFVLVSGYYTIGEFCITLPYGIIGKIMEFFGKRGSETAVGKMLSVLKSLVEAS